MIKTEKVRINSAHSVLWYLKYNTSEKDPQWREIIINFLYNLFDIANRNYGISIIIHNVDGITINYNDVRVCYMHIRQKHLLLHFGRNDYPPIYRQLIKKFSKPHKGSWYKQFHIDKSNSNEIHLILKFLTNLRIIKFATYYRSRTIPSWVKRKVYERDKGRCCKCQSDHDLHYDHDFPFSKGGSSKDPNNIRLLCSKCNLKKSGHIE
jgi:hypothetical protein